MFKCVVRRSSPARSGFMLRAGFSSLALAVGLLSLTSSSAISAGGKAPSRVDAVYSISFNGFNVGSFKFASEVRGKSYSLKGDAELSALLGAFKWRGISRSSGKLNKNGLVPADYVFNFKGSSRSGSIKVGFDKKGVRSASIVPPIPVSADEVPLQRSHLKGALDPLTAVMALTIGSNKSNPCSRKLPIFDGKQRFDLKLSYRGHKTARGFPGQRSQGTGSVVCQVRYQPLGGYRMTSQTRQLAASTGIEISMLPVSGGSLVVPQEVRIPTSVGSVVLTAESVNVSEAGKRKVALLGRR
ncbi:MAG: DUF3108 domain-containing protein [Alphaproteobacteria bacterium]|nr:DUF3108 domain-containing protein [Alphaproteobacteria bacterium]